MRLVSGKTSTKVAALLLLLLRPSDGEDLRQGVWSGLGRVSGSGGFKLGTTVRPVGTLIGWESRPKVGKKSSKKKMKVIILVVCGFSVEASAGGSGFAEGLAGL